jgi:hypothetical protein
VQLSYIYMTYDVASVCAEVISICAKMFLFPYRYVYVCMKFALRSMAYGVGPRSLLSSGRESMI